MTTVRIPSDTAALIDRVEGALDKLAGMIVSDKRNAQKMMLLYQRLERDLKGLREAMTEQDALYASVLNRAAKSQGRKAARSSSTRYSAT